MISNVRGVSGVMVEQVAGLPQIQVRCNHERMAEYGVSVDDVNQVLETALPVEQQELYLRAKESLTSCCDSTRMCAP